MTPLQSVLWDVKQRIENDKKLSKLRQKVNSGKATYADTAAYSTHVGNLLGDTFAQHILLVSPELREALTVELLHDRYMDINAIIDRVQKSMDEAQGLHLAPQHSPFYDDRAHQIGSALADPTVPDETIKRRARAATATATKSMHDDRMKTEAKFRSRAGLNCFITRKAVSGCCAWCTAMAGRYEYGDEPDDIYRRHDNCDCTVTFENGRKRQDVWSKREWEAPEPGAGAGDPIVLTKEQAAAASTGKATVLTPEQAKALQAKHGLTKIQNDAIIETERAMHFRNFKSASAYMEMKFDLSISGLETMPLENLKAVSDCLHKMYRDIPKLEGFIDRIVLADMPDIAKATVRWHGDEPEILLKLSRDYFTSMSISEIEDAIRAACKENIFSAKSDLYGIFKHESTHFAEFYMTFKKYGRNAEARASLNRYELASQIADEAFRLCELEQTELNIKRFISKYAKESKAELIAEAYSSEDTNAIVQEIKRVLKKKWGM